MQIFKDLFLMCACFSLCGVHMSAGTRGSWKGRFPISGVLGSCEASDVDTGNQAHVLCKNNLHP